MIAFLNGFADVIVHKPTPKSRQDGEIDDPLRPLPSSVGAARDHGR
jgi:hypothetical protein